MVDKGQEWESNLWQSLKTTGLAQVVVIHDEKTEAVLKKCARIKPDAIFMVRRTLELGRLNIPVAAIWGDLESAEQVRLSQKLAGVVDLNIYTATSVALHGIKTKKPYVYFWVPKDKAVFFNPRVQRDIEVSFVGTLRPNRVKVVDYLTKHKVKVLVKGGGLTKRGYAGILQRSKICLNFSYSGWLPVMTARSFEITSCGAMLLEEAGPETAKLFKPGVDYVPWFSKKELVEKIHYYLDHDQEREAVAQRGFQTYNQKYSAERFWDMVLAMIKGEREKKGVIKFLPLEDWRLRVQDGFFKNKYWRTICYYLERI